MNNTLTLWWLIPVILLPLFFAMGWFAARVDMRTVLKQAKSIPDGFYRALDALIDRKTNIATQSLNEVIEQQRFNKNDTGAYELILSLGKLYRQRGENDKAVALHQQLLTSPDMIGERHHRLQFELGQDFQNAGLVDRAEFQFEQLIDTDMAKEAYEVLLHIYQQDRDWLKAIKIAEQLTKGNISYQFEIAQFYCELAQNAVFHSDLEEALRYVQAALKTNRKCTRANMILGDIEYEQKHFQAAIDAYSAIEQQNHEYLGMIAERLYESYEAQNQAQEGLNILIGYAKTFPHLDIHHIIYEKSLGLYGEQYAREQIIELIRMRPDLQGVYHLLGIKMTELNPTWKADVDMMRHTVGRYLQKAMMYRCRHCHFKSQVFFWHCPACNKWETFTPNRIEV